MDHMMNRSGEAMHVLALPFPAQGHINPLLCFSKQLAARGFIITFLIPDQAHQLMLQTSHPSEEEEKKESLRDARKSLDIRFAVMPDGSEEPLPGIHPDCQPLSNLITILKGVESQQGVIEELVVRSRDTTHPITCIISDSFFPWTCSLATKLGIQRVLFWASNGATLATAVELKSGKSQSTDGEMAAGVSIARSELLPTLPFRQPEIMKFLIDRMNGLKDTTCIVVNTFEELEGSSLAVAAALCETQVHHIGPNIPLGDHNVASSITFYKEEVRCIEWLDKQAPSSVLYVSFGSVASLAPQEVRELAFGLEESKHPFLWVSRHSDHLLPDGFLDRTHGQGLVVKWAPQMQVLGHVAVGGFLSHCGWNSVLESIHMGVPMLCYPLIHDQHLNALLIARVWKLGISLSKEGTNGLITRDEIQRGVSNVFSSREFHLNSSAWRDASHRTLQRGGGSYCAMEKLVDALKNYAN